jgi:hypothetical protein
MVVLLICQPLSAVLLHMASLATVMTSDGLQDFGGILIIVWTRFPCPFAFAFSFGCKGLL